MSPDVGLTRSIGVELSSIGPKEFDMKYNPYDEDLTENRRTGRPPLPADAKYREQRQRGAMFENLDEDDDAYHRITPQKSQKNVSRDGLK